MTNKNRIPSTAPFAGRFRTAGSVVATEQADTTILLDLRSGRYYTLNPVSGLIWSALATGASMDAVITRVKEEFDAPDEQVTNDVQELVGSLLSRELIHRAN
jgi:hypothetical protein